MLLLLVSARTVSSSSLSDFLIIYGGTSLIWTSIIPLSRVAVCILDSIFSNNKRLTS